MAIFSIGTLLRSLQLTRTVLFVTAITGQVVNVSLGVVEEVSCIVNRVAATSNGAVVVSKAEHTVKCKSGEQLWFLLHLWSCP